MAHPNNAAQIGVMLGIVVALAAPSAAQAFAWIQQFNGPATGSSQFDIANAITQDEFGNIIVVGQSQSDSSGADIITLKYDPDGQLLWSARYDGPAHATDVAFAVAVDSLSNIVVCGASASLGTDQDYITLKYSPQGDLLWEARTGNAGFPLEIARAVAIADNDDVVVTGQSAVSDFVGDCLTVRYAADNGTQQWSQRFTTPGSRFDRGNAIVLAPGGDVIVVGQAEFATSLADVLVVRYAADGSELWLTTYSTVGAHSDRGMAAAAAPDGGILITGDAVVQGTNVDFLTMRVEPDGAIGWVQTFGEAALNADRGIAIAVDLMGNAYVAGSSRTLGGNDDFRVVAYSPGGVQLWTRGYEGPAAQVDVARSIQVDPFGGVYVGGESRGSGTDFDIAIVKYDDTGSQQWVTRFNGADNRADLVRGIWVDKCGNVYATGYTMTTSSSASDVITLKIVPGSVSPCVADLNGDGQVAIDDLSELLASFGFVGPIAPADLDCNGRIDLADLTALLAAFGGICSH